MELRYKISKLTSKDIEFMDKATVITYDIKEALLNKVRVIDKIEPAKYWTVKVRNMRESAYIYSCWAILTRDLQSYSVNKLIELLGYEKSYINSNYSRSFTKQGLITDLLVTIPNISDFIKNNYKEIKQ